MTALIPFAYGDTLIRSVLRDGEPWFVATDVCKALDLENSRQSVSRLDDDEKGVTTVDTLGGRQEVAIVSEPGVYRLVFTSRKAEAERFKRWLAHDVLPQLRRRGAYVAPGAEPAPEAPADDKAFWTGVLRRAQSALFALGEPHPSVVHMPRHTFPEDLSVDGARDILRLPNGDTCIPLKNGGWRLLRAGTKTQSTRAVTEYRPSPGIVDRFFRDCVTQTGNAFDRVPATMLYAAFLAWCEREGFPDMGMKAFGTAANAYAGRVKSCGVYRTHIRLKPGFLPAIGLPRPRESR
jgi:prophage antirepressor-like protein